MQGFGTQRCQDGGSRYQSAYRLHPRKLRPGDGNRILTQVLETILVSFTTFGAFDETDISFINMKSLEVANAQLKDVVNSEIKLIVSALSLHL